MNGRLEISFSHGTAWTMLISTYISDMPFNGEPFWTPMQNMSG